MVRGCGGQCGHRTLKGCPVGSQGGGWTDLTFQSADQRWGSAVYKLVPKNFANCACRGSVFLIVFHSVMLSVRCVGQFDMREFVAVLIFAICHRSDMCSVRSQGSVSVVVSLSDVVGALCWSI